MNIKLEINEFVRAFIESCDVDAHSRIIRMLDSLCQYGHELRMPHARPVADGVHELRILGRENIRIFYVFCRSHAVLFYAMNKKTQKLSKRDMRRITKMRKTVID